MEIIGDRKVMIEDLVKELHEGKVRAPVLRMSTKVFMRTYPELFLIETSLVSGKSSVRRNKNLDPPLYF